MSLQNGTLAETRPAFDATFTQISMNHSEPGKRRPRRRGGTVAVWPSDNRKVKRRRRFPHWHAPWTRSRRRYARVTLEFAQRTHSGFRAGKMHAVPTRFVGWISHLLYYRLCLRNLIWSVATVHPINLSFRLGRRAGRAVVSFSRVTVPILPPSFSPPLELT